MSRVPGETRFDVGWGSLAALTWSNPGAPRAIALHGWMDNAHSFLPLAEHLDDLDLVALELAGHGHSDHRPEGTHYYLAENLFDLDRVLDQLGWEDCILIGHSLGAGITSAYAAASPERVSRLVLIDGMGMIVEPASDALERLRKSIQSQRNPRQHRRVYASSELAAKTRQSNSPMQDSSALALADRALVKTSDGLRWRTDPGLMWKSPILPTEDQARALLRGIECPTLALTTSALAAYLGSYLTARAEMISELEFHELEGAHHVHMDNPGLAAGFIKVFLNNSGEHNERKS